MVKNIPYQMLKKDVVRRIAETITLPAIWYAAYTGKVDADTAMTAFSGISLLWMIEGMYHCGMDRYRQEISKTLLEGYKGDISYKKRAYRSLQQKFGDLISKYEDLLEKKRKKEALLWQIRVLSALRREKGKSKNVCHYCSIADETKMTPSERKEYEKVKQELNEINEKISPIKQIIEKEMMKEIRKYEKMPNLEKLTYKTQDILNNVWYYIALSPFIIYKLSTFP